MSSTQVTDALTKKILGGIYVQTLKLGESQASLDSFVTNDDISNMPYALGSIYHDYISRLENEGLVSFDPDSTIRLTASGRRNIVVVMIGGAFDIIHPGHVETLRRAKALGDVLAVSVARNSTYRKNKGKEPIHDERLRLDLIISMKFVDVAVLGSENDIFETVLFLKPDIIALGYDQSHSENSIREGAKKVGIDVRVVRLESSVPAIKTSSIVNSNDKEKLLAGT